MKQTRAYERVLPAVIGILLPLILGSLYWTSAHQRLTGYADSDELILAIARGQLAHPPGYPLLVWALQPWRIGASGADLIWWLQKSVSLNTAFNVGLVYVIGLTWGNRSGLGRRQAVLLAVLSAWSWGLLASVWTHATVLEVFPLAQTLILCTFLGVIKAGIPTANTRRWWWIASISATMGWWYHPLTLLATGPVLAYGIWAHSGRRKRTQMAGIVLGCWLGTALISYSLSLKLAEPAAGTIWPMGTSLRQWLAFWWRQPYGNTGSAIETAVHDWRASRIWATVLVSGRLWLVEMTGLGILLMIGGGYWGFRHARGWFWVLLVSLLLAGPGVFLYLKMPIIQEATEIEYFWGLGLRQRMNFAFLTSSLFFLYWGWEAMVQWASRVKMSERRLLLGLVFMSLGIVSGYRWWQMNAAESNLVPVWVEAVLREAAADTTLVVDSDLFFSFKAAQEILGLRPDVTVINPRLPTTFVQNETETAIVTASDDPLWGLVFVLNHRLRQGTPVRLIGAEGDLLQRLGVEGNPFYAQPRGYGIDIRLEPGQATASDYGISEQVVHLPQRERSLWVRGMRAYFGLLHTQLGYYWQRLGDTETAEYHRGVAQRVSERDRTKENINRVIDQAQERWEAEGSYAWYIQLSAQEYRDKAVAAEVEGDVQRAEYFYTRALLAEVSDRSHLEKLRQWQQQLRDR